MLQHRVLFKTEYFYTIRILLYNIYYYIYTTYYLYYMYYYINYYYIILYIDLDNIIMIIII